MQPLQNTTSPIYNPPEKSPLTNPPYPPFSKGGIYLLFGKVGSGKSFIGDYLQRHHGFIHFDGDRILTDDMKAAIAHGETMSTAMIDRYMSDLTQEIRRLYQHHTQPIVISQGMYRNKNRLELLREFPQLQFVLVEADADICHQRIQQRNNTITSDYARKISALFESPQGFEYAIIRNNAEIDALTSWLEIFQQSIQLIDTQ